MPCFHYCSSEDLSFRHQSVAGTHQQASGHLKGWGFKVLIGVGGFYDFWGVFYIILLNLCF